MRPALRAVRFLALLVIAIAGSGAFTACGKGGGSGQKVTPELVAGVYTTTQFLEPGANDAGVNVHTAGGYMNVTITPDHKVEGRLVIPAGIGSSEDGADRAFQGTWKSSGAGIVIEGTGTLIDGHEWICGTGLLEMARAGRAPMEIRLQKMHDLTK